MLGLPRLYAAAAVAAIIAVLSQVGPLKSPRKRNNPVRTQTVQTVIGGQWRLASPLPIKGVVAVSSGVNSHHINPLRGIP